MGRRRATTRRSDHSPGTSSRRASESVSGNSAPPGEPLPLQLRRLPSKRLPRTLPSPDRAAKFRRASSRRSFCIWKARSRTRFSSCKPAFETASRRRNCTPRWAPFRWSSSDTKTPPPATGKSWRAIHRTISQNNISTSVRGETERGEEAASTLAERGQSNRPPHGEEARGGHQRAASGHQSRRPVGGCLLRPGASAVRGRPF